MSEHHQTWRWLGRVSPGGLFELPFLLACASRGAVTARRCVEYPQKAVTNWSVRLSDGIRARIVGNVNEDGMWWWRNGVRQSRNAPHPSRSKYYVFHGTLNPMWNGDLITYQDYISFRHNIGSGGRGSVLFAGQYRVG